MDLHLDESQTDLLRQVLDSTYRDLRYEVADTDLSKFKDQLRVREAALRAILDMVGGPLQDAP